MNSQNNLNLGDEIKNLVQDALKNSDFNKLNRDIGNIVKGALDEVKKSNTGKKVVYRQEIKTNKPVKRTTKHIVPVGQVSNILLTVFGTIGSTAFGIGAVVLALLGFSTGNNVLFHTIASILSIGFIISMILSMNGASIRKRLKRFQRYITQMGSRSYCTIRELSLATGQSDKATVKDLRKMIAIGMFPEGHIDDKNTYFMINNETYEQYLGLQRKIMIMDLEKQRNQKEQIVSESYQDKDKTNNELKPEIRRAIDEGRQFVVKIRDANVAIPDEEISGKLDRLEEVTGKIFDHVEKHPEKISEIRKFTEYFLPTTLKLVDAYKNLDHQPVQGENILSAKKEIEKTMDTINIAFEKLLDDLFEDLAMDISTDISVLETMFAQEGLSEKSIRVNNNTMEDER